MNLRKISVPILLSLAFFSLGGAGHPGKVPITARTEKARQLYLEGRTLTEAYRLQEAEPYYQRAIAEDPEMTLALLALADGHFAGLEEMTNRLKRALAASEKASPGEQLIAQARSAGVRGDRQQQTELLRKLTQLYPNDERVHALLGNHCIHAGNCQAEGLSAFERSLAINPQYVPVYNSLGYGYVELAKYDEAERVFKKYIELMPDQANPRDSYAELLMKTGRFDESIAQYQKALAIDPKFPSAYIGIGHNQILLGRGEEARQTFAKAERSAPSPDARRTAFFWIAMSFVHEGATDKALAAVGEMTRIAKEKKDLAWVSQDLRLKGNILLEAGRTKDALAKFEKRLGIVAELQLPPDLKQRSLDVGVYDRARVAVAENDLLRAKTLADTFAAQVAKNKSADSLLLQHELLGRIALSEKQYDTAIAELAQAGRNRPEVIYLQAEAWAGKGDTARARALYREAADFNAIAGPYAYVRNKARRSAGNS